RVIHSFLNNPRDGCDPLASLISVKGILYGTTCCGGGYFEYDRQGTLFSVNPSTGEEHVLHEFGEPYSSYDDGSEPVASLVDVRRVLYGTADIGGLNNCAHGCGVIFSYTLSQSNPTYQIVYPFKGKKDGAYPRAGLLYSRGGFYGTTTFAGKNNL